MAGFVQIGLLLACFLVIVKPMVPIDPVVIIENEQDNFVENSPIGLGILLLLLAFILPLGLTNFRGGNIFGGNLFNVNNAMTSGGAANVMTAANGMTVVTMNQGGMMVVPGRGGGVMVIDDSGGRGGGVQVIDDSGDRGGGEVVVTGDGGRGGVEVVG